MSRGLHHPKWFLLKWEYKHYSNTHRIKVLNSAVSRLKRRNFFHLFKQCFSYLSSINAVALQAMSSSPKHGARIVAKSEIGIFNKNQRQCQNFQMSKDWTFFKAQVSKKRRPLHSSWSLSRISNSMAAPNICVNQLQKAPSLRIQSRFN